MGNISRRPVPTEKENELSGFAVTLVSAKNLSAPVPSVNIPMSPSAKLSCSFNQQAYTRQAVSGGVDPVFEDNATKFYSTKLSESALSLSISFYGEDATDKSPSILGQAIIPIDPLELESGGSIERWYPIQPVVSESVRWGYGSSSPRLQVKRPRTLLSCSSPADNRLMAEYHQKPASKQQAEVLVRINFSKFPRKENLDVESRTPDKPIEEFYEIGKVLGKGGFSVVMQARDKETNREVAVKIIDIESTGKKIQKDLRASDEDFIGEVDEDPSKAIELEIEIMKMLNHPNIVRFYECFRTPKKVFVVMELVTGGELLDVVSKKGFLAPPEAAAILRQVLHAVEYMHKNGIVHRDLKLENLLLDETHTIVKITDFGLSKNYFNEALSKCVGSILYVAPEVLVCDTYDNAVDIWSIGVMAYMLLSGCAPFDAPGDDEMEIFEKICQGDYSLDTPEWKEIGQDTKDFIRKVLVTNPHKRATATELLEHPWIKLVELPKPNVPSPQAKGVAIRLSQLKTRSQQLKARKTTTKW